MEKPEHVHIEEPLEEWDGELSCVRHDRQTGAWLIVAVHSTVLGPAAGGTRAMHYPSPGHAAVDATRLAAAMTLKMAVAGLPMGGGKAVIALPRLKAALDDADWRRLLQLHAAVLERLHGTYWTGPDVGTGSEDMDVLRSATRYAFGASPPLGGPGSSAPATAAGVFAAIQAASTEAGLEGLDGRRVLVQGMGAVGSLVGELAADSGAQLLVTDVDPARCRSAIDRGARFVASADATRTECDVLVPCATGGLVDAAIARTVPCTVIAGAANNPLAGDRTADILAERGIVYAPDFVANAGGAIHLVGRQVLGWTADQVHDRTAAIGTTLQAIFADSRARGITADQAARDLAAGRLQPAGRVGS